MAEDSSKRTDERTGAARARRVDPADAEESLSEALSGLERILVRRRQGRPDDAGQAQANPPRAAPDDAQYSIPMLNDVVVPGNDAPSDHAAAPEHADAPEAGFEEEELCRRLTERLANEIEVIVQARIETAVQEAAGDIREQVRKHLEIMLPEIIEELSALDRRRHD